VLAIAVLSLPLDSEDVIYRWIDGALPSIVSCQHTWPRWRAGVTERAIEIRDANPDGDDARACAAVYAPYVTDTVISFEDLAPSAQELRGRMLAAYAWLVAVDDGRVIGYAYGTGHREREAYRWAADVTVYIDAAHHRAGVGRALYSVLFERLRAAGLWTLCAGITQPNDASNALHRSMGFTPVGTFRRIGWKAGAWQDVLWLELDLRPGEDGPPPAELEIFKR
jgi:L-amino acid N-acyltransferase YncA